MQNPRILSLAHEQDGLVTRQQALAAGASPDAVRHAIGVAGRWQVVVPGVYATFTGPVAQIHRLRAAVLHVGDGAMITGSAACVMIGLKYVPTSSGAVDVLTGFQRHPRSSGFIRVHRTVRMPKPVWWMDTASPGAANDHDRSRPWWVPGDDLAPVARRWVIAMAPSARAVVDAVRFHWLALRAAGPVEVWQRRNALQDTRALLCEVVQRRHCTPAELDAEVAAAPLAGTVFARRARDDIVAGCRSAPECELRDVVRSSRVLPEPRWNKRLPGYDGVLYPDACWPEARLVVEVNSREWHRYGNAPEATERRQALYAALGWTVFPVSPFRLRQDPDGVRRDLVAAYRAGLQG